MFSSFCNKLLNIIEIKLQLKRILPCVMPLDRLNPFQREPWVVSVGSRDFSNCRGRRFERLYGFL